MRRTVEKMMLVAGALTVCAGFAGIAATGAARPNHGRSVATNAQSITVTGCLKQNGDEKDEYAITGKDGKKYGLKSKTVSLSAHVGHTVTVTGTAMAKGDDEDEKTEKSSGASKEVGDLQVTKLTMVSANCQ